MTSQNVLLKAGGLQTYFNNLSEVSPGALLKATNTVINREGVIEPRRGIAAYGNALVGTTTRAKQLLEYKGRIIRHVLTDLAYDDGTGVFTNFSGSFTEAATGVRTKSCEANSNFYFTTSEGIKKISATSAADFTASPNFIYDAGAPKAIDGLATVNYSVPGFLNALQKVAYRVVWGYKDANGILILGSPSLRIIANNNSSTNSTSVDIKFYIPYNVTTTNFFFRIYRSEATVLDPSDELNLVFEGNPTASELTTGYIIYNDFLSESLRPGGTPLYTNIYSGDSLYNGIAGANEPPPFATDICLYKQHMFLANTRIKHFTNLSLLTTVGFTSGVSKFTITDGTSSNTYTFVGAAGVDTVTTTAPGAIVGKAGVDKVKTTAKASITDASFFLLNNKDNTNKFFVWYDKTGSTSAPSTAQTIGRTGIRVDISAITLATAIATATSSAINTAAGADFTCTVSVDEVTITKDVVGYTDATVDSADRPTLFTFTSLTVGTEAPFFLLSNASNTTNYFVWYDKTGSVIAPNVCPETVGRVAIRVNISTAATADDVAAFTATAITAAAPVDFLANANTNIVTITKTSNGNTTATADSTNAPTLFTFANSVAGDGENAAAKEVLLSSKASVTAAVEEMARSIAQVVNAQTAEVVSAFYISGSNDTPGQLVFQRKNLEDKPFTIVTPTSAIADKFAPELGLQLTNSTISTTNPITVTTSNAHNLSVNDKIFIFGASTTPSVNGYYKVASTPLTTTYTVAASTTVFASGGYTAIAKVFSENDAKGNRLYYSKFQEVEAVPSLNYFDVGSKDKAIIRIIALRESLFILKEDGVYRLTGESKLNFTVNLFDSTAIIQAPDTATVLHNEIYFLGNQGAMKLTETVADSNSRPIENLIIPYITTAASLSTASFAIAYESDRSYLLFTVSNKNDTVATVCYRFNYVTNTWTDWNVSKTCAVLNRIQDKLYFGSGSDNYLEVERKNFNYTDYADRDLPISLLYNSISETDIKVSDFSICKTEDVLAQVQYITIAKFNNLLSQLDTDHGLAGPYYSALSIGPGANLTNAMTALVAKLNTDDTNSFLDSAGNTSYVFTGSSNFVTIQTEYNKIIVRLNESPTTLLTNYQTSTGSIELKYVITDRSVVTNMLTLNNTPYFFQGALKLYKGIDVNIEYTPIHMGDPSIYKQISEATSIFEFKNFYTAHLGFNSDLSPNYEFVDFVPNAVGNWGEFEWGNGTTWGGEGDRSPLRTYVPRQKQRCRYIGVRFKHGVALESFALYGISLTYNTYSARAYR